jgi:SagB-type dehydrogenase family enzyme
MDTLDLPPIPTAAASLISVLGTRRSRRDFTGAPLTAEEVALLLWAAHGVTSDDGRRTSPSAGFTDPSSITAITAAWTGRYRGERHHIEVHTRSDLRPELAHAAGSQQMIETAGLVVAVAARVSRTAARYGSRAERYVTLEAGHIAQNVLLAAEALALGAVPVGAFDDEEVTRLLALEDEKPLYLLPVGRMS